MELRGAPCTHTAPQGPHADEKVDLVAADWARRPHADWKYRTRSVEVPRSLRAHPVHTCRNVHRPSVEDHSRVGIFDIFARTWVNAAKVSDRVGIEGRLCDRATPGGLRG